MKLDRDSCFSVAAGFTSRKAFKEQANSEYQWLGRNGLLAEATAHIQPSKRKLTDSVVAEIARHYSGRREFKLGDQSAYNYANRRGLLDAVCVHMTPARRALSDEQLHDIASTFSSRTEFARSDYGAYQAATRRGLLDDFCSHMVDGHPTRRLEDDEILSIARQFKTRNDFKLGDFGAYTTAFRRKLIERACEHMEYGACGFREDKPAVVYQFRIDLPDGGTLWKVGITNRKPRQRLMTMGIVRGVRAELTGCMHFPLGRDARLTEKRLHSEFASHRYSGPAVMKNGNTELFTVNVLGI